MRIGINREMREPIEDWGGVPGESPAELVEVRITMEECACVWNLKVGSSFVGGC